MSLILKIFITGFSILFVALIINILAGLLGISTWYDFLHLIREKGFLGAFKETSLISLIFLIFIYPFLLGLAGYFSFTLFK